MLNLHNAIAIFICFFMCPTTKTCEKPLTWAEAVTMRNQTFGTTRNEADFSASCAAFAPDNSILAFGSDEGAIRIFNPELGLINSYSHNKQYTDPIVALAFLGEKHFVSAMLNQGIQIWDLAQQNFPTISINKKIFSCIANSSNTVTAGQEEGVVSLHDIRQKQSIRLGKHASEAKTLASLENGQVVAAGDCSGIISIWDTRKREEAIASTESHYPAFVNAIATKNRQLISADSSQRIFVWNYINNFLQKKYELKLEKTNSAIKSIAFVPDNSGYLCTTRDGKTFFIDKETHAATEIIQSQPQKPLQTYSSHALSFSSDAKHLAIAHGAMHHIIKRK